MTRAGTFVSIDGQPALRFERRYRQPIERVWRAITEPDELSQWFPADVVGERAVGAELVFDDDAQRAEARAAGEPTRDDGPVFRGTVVAYDPPTVFSFTWGGELLRFELLADGAGTTLVFTHLLDYLRSVGPSLGIPAGGDGALTWERWTHVDPDRVRAATSDPDELARWGGHERAGDRLRWDVEGVEHGTRYRLTVEGAGDDAAVAATWHALLLQLDMYLAAGQLVPVAPDPWIADYGRALGGTRPAGG
jgi:uncharacterized protein YndB with AHSA1/START domain